MFVYGLSFGRSFELKMEEFNGFKAFVVHGQRLVERMRILLIRIQMDFHDLSELLGLDWKQAVNIQEGNLDIAIRRY